METHFYPIQICMFMKQTWRQRKNNALKQGLMVYMSGLFFSGSVKASWPKLRVDRIFAKIKTLRHVIFAWPNLRVFFWTKSSRPSQNREVMSTRSLKSRIGGRREEMGVYSRVYCGIFWQHFLVKIKKMWNKRFVSSIFCAIHSK